MNALLPPSLIAVVQWVMRHSIATVTVVLFQLIATMYIAYGTNVMKKMRTTSISLDITVIHITQLNVYCIWNKCHPVVKLKSENCIFLSLSGNGLTTPFSSFNNIADLAVKIRTHYYSTMNALLPPSLIAVVQWVMRHSIATVTVVLFQLIATMYIAYGTNVMKKMRTTSISLDIT